MTTPANNTPYAIITDAMVDAGLLKTGQTPSSEKLADGLRRLEDIINFEQTQGLKLFLDYDLPITLTAGVATYTLGPTGTVVMTKPLRVLQAYWLSAVNVRTPLVALSWNEYLNLSQTSGNNGALNSYFVNKQATTLGVSFYLTPDAEAATGTAHLLIQQQVTNPISLTETMAFPPEWRVFLHWALADEICTGQPETIMTRCAQRCERYREALNAWDVEDAATEFQPDSRMGQTTNNFV